MERSADTPKARFVRQSEDDVPQKAPKRIVRQAIDMEAEKPKHLRQETLYSSVTTLSRKKRGQNVNVEA
jgi:hypothetical protein